MGKINWAVLKENKYVRNIYALTLGALFAFCLLEILLQVYNPIPFRIKSDRIVLKANQKIVLSNAKVSGLASVIVHQKNSLGFRGEDPPTDLDNYFSIFSVGGSTTECFYNTQGSDWPNILGNHLKKDFNNVWLNNAGLDGLSTFGELILMNDYVVKLKPKVVYFLVGVNDIEREDLRSYDQNILESEQFSFKNFLKKSEILQLAVNLERAWDAQRRGLISIKMNPRPLDQSETLEISVDQQQSVLNEQREKYLDDYKARLNALIKLCKDNDIEPVLITQPTLLGDAADPETGVLLANVKYKKFNGSLFWRVLELYNEVTRQTGEQAGIKVIDLAREMPKNSIYYFDPVHYTDAGSAKVADIVFNDSRDFLVQKFPQFKK